MTMDIEWRNRNGEDAILLVDSSAEVSEVCAPNDASLTDYLAVTGNLSQWRNSLTWHPVQGPPRDARGWGELVLSRRDSGEITFMDPELFWEGIYRWFRSRGVDVDFRAGNRPNAEP
jgi:hypothetical protein